MLAVLLPQARGEVAGMDTLAHRTNALVVLAGAIGGICGSFLSYPFEMLRAARMHNRSFMDEMVKQ